MYRSGFLARLSAVGLVVALPVSAANADAVADFYKGKTITIYAGSSAGGGYDTYARALGRFIGKHIPGNPTVINSNMPGGTGLKLTNWLYNVGPKDGTVIAMVGRGLPAHELLGGTGARFDPARLNWIGSMNNEVSVCVTSERSPVKKFGDLKSHEAIFGSQGGVADSHLFALFVKNLFNARMRVVAGYPGTAETVVAMERGEVDGICGWSWTSVKIQRPKWVSEGKINILLQLALSKHEDLPNVPLISDLTTDPAELGQVRLVFSRQTMGRPVTVAQDVPGERVAALRAAFDATMRDPAFRKFAARTKLEVSPVSGKEIQELVESVLATPKAVVKRTIENLKER